MPAIVVGSWDPAFGVKDLCVVGSYAYVVGRDTDTGWDGLEIVDVSNPSAPARAGLLALSNAGGVTVAGSYAYLGSSRGIYSVVTVVDVSDPANPMQLGECLTRVGVQPEGPVAPGGGAQVGAYATVGAAGHMAIAGSILYTLGLQIIDVSNPFAPVWLSWYHTVQDNFELRVSGTTVYIAEGDSSTGSGRCLQSPESANDRPAG